MATIPLVQVSNAVDKRSKDSPYYFKTVGDKLSPVVKELFENYSDIPPEDVEKHVYDMRDLAWKIEPYPCIGIFAFLDLSICKHPSYERVLELLKPKSETPEDQANFLDLACCFGQDIRKLVYDGVPASAVYGTDIKKDFLELGFELFKDKDKFPDPDHQFFVANVLDADGLDDLEKAGIWKEMLGKFAVVEIANVLHLFNYDSQLQICCLIARIIAAKPGCLVVGGQLGTEEPREVPKNIAMKDLISNGKVQTKFWHSPETFRQMWAEAGERTGTKWDVEVEFFNFQKTHQKSLDRMKQNISTTHAQHKREEARYLIFTVTRVA